MLMVSDRSDPQGAEPPVRDPDKLLAGEAGFLHVHWLLGRRQYGSYCHPGTLVAYGVIVR